MSHLACNILYKFENIEVNNLLLKLIPFTGTQKKFYINVILSNTYRLFHRFDEIVKKFYKNMYNWIIQKVGALL